MNWIVEAIVGGIGVILLAIGCAGVKLWRFVIAFVGALIIVHVISVDWAIDYTKDKPTYAEVDSIVAYKVDSLLKERGTLARLTLGVCAYYDDNAQHINYMRGIRQMYYYGTDTCIGGE